MTVRGPITLPVPLAAELGLGVVTGPRLRQPETFAGPRHSAAAGATALGRAPVLSSVSWDSLSGGFSDLVGGEKHAWGRVEG